MGMLVSKTSGAAPLSLATLEANSIVVKELYEESSNESVNINKYTDATRVCTLLFLIIFEVTSNIKFALDQSSA